MNFMKKGKLFFMTLIIALIPLLVNVVAFPHMSDRIPVHWGINGKVDRYGSKIEQLMMSTLPIIIFAVINFLPAIDPKRESYKKHAKAFGMINFGIILFISCINMAALFSSLGFDVPTEKVLPILLGILFIVLGNYMSQIRHNYFFGIRTPWTLASEHVWKKTHRFGGYVFVLIGFVSLISIFINSVGMIIFFGALVIGTMVVILYSYIIYKKNFPQK